MVGASDKDLPPTPRTTPVLLLHHPYQVVSSSQINYSPVTLPPTLSRSQFQPVRVATSTLFLSTYDRKPPRDQLGHLKLLERHPHRHHPDAPLRQPPLSPPNIETKNNPRAITPLYSGTKSCRLIYIPIFLLLPPILSLLYLVTGHAILQRGTSSTYWSPPLLSSARAGAIGGAVLSLPLFLLTWLIIPLPPSSPIREAQEDFFDEDFLATSHVSTVMRVGTRLVHLCCCVLTLGVGSAAGPLGVSCLTGGGSGAPGRPAMLTPATAAQAGALGSVVIWASLLVVSTSAFFGYAILARWIGTYDQESGRSWSCRMIFGI
jgi:hypothetical protein